MNELTFPGPEYDMTTEVGPVSLTAAEFRAMPVSAERLKLRRLIWAMEARMRSPEVEKRGLMRIEPGHVLAEPVLHWLPGILIREMHLFAGLFVTGKRHAKEHHNIISCGSATVMTELGWQAIEGPLQFKSPAGTKRALMVHEAMIWTTVHRTEARTIEEAEAELMLIDEPELQCLG